MADSGENKDLVDSDRSVRSLTGLLKFCVEGTKAEDAPSGSTVQEMTDERRHWLKGAMEAALENDPVKLMKETIDKLKAPGIESNIEECCGALDNLINWCEDLDLANAFDDINGLSVLKPLLNGSNVNEDIQCRVVTLLATLAQNNPRWQKCIIDNDLLPWMITQVSNEQNNLSLRTKALGVVSAACRNSPIAVVSLLDDQGLVTVLSTLDSSHDPLVTKASFLCASLCSSDEGTNVSERFLKCGILQYVARALKKPHGCAHEHLARTLNNVINNSSNEDVVKQCQSPALGLREILSVNMKAIQGLEEFHEEQDYYQHIWKTCFSD